MDPERDDDDAAMRLELSPDLDAGLGSAWIAARPLVPRRALRVTAREALRRLYEDLDGDVLDLEGVD